MAQVSEQKRRTVERAVRQWVRQQGRRPSRIAFDSPHLTTQTPTTGQLSEFMRITVPRGRAFVFPDNARYRFILMAEEEFTSDGTGGNDETFNLSNNLVSSPWIADPDESQTSGGAEVAATGRGEVVLYDADTQQAMVSVSQANDQVTYADAGTGSTIEVYYIWSETSQIQAEHWNNNETERFGRAITATDVTTLHTVDVNDESRAPRFEGNTVLLPKEHLIWKINTSVDLTDWDNSEAFPLVEIPAIEVPLSQVPV